MEALELMSIVTSVFTHTASAGDDRAGKVGLELGPTCVWVGGVGGGGVSNAESTTIR